MGGALSEGIRARSDWTGCCEKAANLLLCLASVACADTPRRRHLQFRLRSGAQLPGRTRTRSAPVSSLRRGSRPGRPARRSRRGAAGRRSAARPHAATCPPGRHGRRWQRVPRGPTGRDVLRGCVDQATDDRQGDGERQPPEEYCEQSRAHGTSRRVRRGPTGTEASTREVGSPRPAIPRSRAVRVPSVAGCTRSRVVHVQNHPSVARKSRRKERSSASSEGVAGREVSQSGHWPHWHLK